MKELFTHILSSGYHQQKVYYVTRMTRKANNGNINQLSEYSPPTVPEANNCFSKITQGLLLKQPMRALQAL